ncbi:MAG: 50S ribosomal protein L10 [Bacteroidales bacterium]|nr:50S ribosomal protein L10 [Candidatus Physcousia equi]
MRKEDKVAVIAQLGELLKKYPHFYLVDVEGMDAASSSELRRNCFKNNVKMVVVKNTLFQKALEASELDCSALYSTLVGTTGVIFTDVANMPAKMLKDYASKKAEKPALKAAYAEEGCYVGANQLDVLCSIKSKNEVIAEIVALLQSPAKNVISALQSGANTIHGVLKTLGEKGE